MDPEQTASIGAVCSGATLFAIEASYTFQQKRKADDFCFDLHLVHNVVINALSILTNKVFQLHNLPDSM